MVLVTGCDKACDVSVTTVAKIDNLTSRDLNIKVCNRWTGRLQSIALLATQVGEFAIETHIEKKISTGGPANACDPVKYNTGIFLASENFTQYKFCHDPSTTAKVVVIEFNQTCPDGLIAQQTAIDNCSM